MESPKRSMAKALAWRFGATTITGGVADVIWGSIGRALGIGVADLLARRLVYCPQERAWLKIPFGQGRPAEYDI